MVDCLARRAAVLALVASAFALLVVGQNPAATARVHADVDGNLHVATANSTLQRVFLNGVDVLGELSRLSSAVEAKAMSTREQSTTTTTTTETPLAP
jgi:hypothetical protein